MAVGIAGQKHQLQGLPSKRCEEFQSPKQDESPDTDLAPWLLSATPHEGVPPTNLVLALHGDEEVGVADEHVHVLGKVGHPDAVGEGRQAYNLRLEDLVILGLPLAQDARHNLHLRGAWVEGDQKSHRERV